MSDTNEQSRFYAYRTVDEINFIDGLGTSRWSAVTHTRISRHELLRAYIAGAERRAEWGHVSKVAAIEHARKVLGAPGC